MTIKQLKILCFLAFIDAVLIWGGILYIYLTK